MYSYRKVCGQLQEGWCICAGSIGGFISVVCTDSGRNDRFILIFLIKSWFPITTLSYFVYEESFLAQALSHGETFIGPGVLSHGETFIGPGVLSHGETKHRDQ